MQTSRIGSLEIESSRLVYGCMRIAGDGSTADREKGRNAIHAAVEEGYTHFDHADIYAGGESERLFGEVLKASPALRDRLVITGKCGIRLAGQPGAEDPGRYDFSRRHILDSVEGSLRRLGTDRLDFLLLHRPDYLCDPGAVAAAFEALESAGKVRHFGVSNFRPGQVEMLQAHCPMPLQVNQVEINIHNLSVLEDGTLDQCLKHRITPMAWCPMGGVAYPAWGNTLSAADEERIRAELQRQAESYSATPEAVVLAWLLLHPAGILPIVGSTTPARIRAAVKALDVHYRREDWYRLLEARVGTPVL